MGNNPIRFNDPDGHCGPLCIIALAAVVIVGMATQPADVLAPDEELAANHPPLEPGYNPVDYVRDFQNGQYVAGAMGVALEVTPIDKIPGVSQLAKGASEAVLNSVSDFAERAVRRQAERNLLSGFANDSFGDIWSNLARMYAEGAGSGSLFTFSDANGVIRGMMQLDNIAHSSGALKIKTLEGLGGGTGAGTKLFQQAVLQSQQHFNGGIFLEAKPGSIDWYKSLNPTQMGFTNSGNPTFYWSPEDAAKLLNQ